MAEMGTGIDPDGLVHGVPGRALAHLGVLVLGKSVCGGAVSNLGGTFEGGMIELL